MMRGCLRSYDAMNRNCSLKISANEENLDRRMTALYINNSMF